jgi:hypothetical protein
MARRPARTVSRKFVLPRFQITTPSLPGSVILDVDSLDAAVRDCEERQSLLDYLVDRVEAALWETLLRFGWSYAEIEAAVDNPRAALASLVTLYGSAATFA